MLSSLSICLLVYLSAGLSAAIPDVLRFSWHSHSKQQCCSKCERDDHKSHPRVSVALADGMGLESSFIQGSVGPVWVMIWALTQCCHSICIKDRKNVCPSFYSFFFLSLIQQICNRVGGGFMWLSIIFNWPILDWGHAGNRSLSVRSIPSMCPLGY